MKHRSLILSASREGRFFQREYLLASLQSVIGRIQDSIVSFGPLAKNNDWHIVLKTEEAKNKLLSAGQLHVKGLVFSVRPWSWPRARSGAWCRSRPLGLAARLDQVSFCEPTSHASVCRVIWTNHHSANNQHPSNKLSENYRKKICYNKTEHYCKSKCSKWVMQEC